MGEFRLGDLVRMKDDSWWRNKNASRWTIFTADDSLVLVTKLDHANRSGFFYGRVCSTGEERLWTTGEFELVSKRP